MDEQNLLVVEKLKKYFPVTKGFFKKASAYVRAVEEVDLAVKRGETIGLVGESGCGKTTLGRCILRLEEPTEGRVYFEDQDILSYDRGALRQLRRNMQIIFQDPYSSLNPRKTVGQIIGEGFHVHKLLSKKASIERVRELMHTVGLLPEQINRYPHEFSGGQRQRISIARALSLHPKLIIADEPVSSLDVSIQAQILNLLVELQRQFSLTYVFISHGLSVVRHLSDRVAVMYLGRIVELAGSRSLFSHPFHPYTEALMSAVPQTNPLKRRDRILLQGDVPSPIDPPPGCSFHPRCRYRQPVCMETVPGMVEAEENHWVRCYFPRI
jgi:oligopeptide/dipeptide ABC transporter ATP-binding protein